MFDILWSECVWEWRRCLWVAVADSRCDAKLSRKYPGNIILQILERWIITILPFMVDESFPDGLSLSLSLSLSLPPSLFLFCKIDHLIDNSL
jgi:hypothetical protein